MLGSTPLRAILAASLIWTVVGAVAANGADPQPIAFWDMDPGYLAAGIAEDRSGHGHHGTIVRARPVEGRVGGALEFVNGDDAHVVVAAHPDLDLGSAFTLAAWIFLDGYGQGGTGAILDRLYLPDAEGYALLVTNSYGRASLMFYGLTEQGALVSDPGSLQLGRWQHIAVVCDGLLLKFYVDGEPCGAEIAIHDLRPTSRDLHIGNNLARWRDFDGRIDDLRIFDEALGADQVGELADGQEACRLRLDLDREKLSWNERSDDLGYDVVRGDLRELRSGGGDFSSATEKCVADNQPTGALGQDDDPPPGESLWFLVRRVRVEGDCSFDSMAPGQFAGRDARIAASGQGCD